MSASPIHILPTHSLLTATASCWGIYPTLDGAKDFAHVHSGLLWSGDHTLLAQDFKLFKDFRDITELRLSLYGTARVAMRQAYQLWHMVSCHVTHIVC